MEWLRDNWLKVHLAISPLGALVVTWLLAFAVGSGQWWNDRNTLELTGQIVPLGGVVYGSVILVLEVTTRMLWALAQRQRDKEKWRKEGIQEGRREGRQEGRQEGREEAIRELLDRGVDLPPDLLKDIKEPNQ